MESNYRKEDFEHYVKKNADQYRMFPSDKVWKGINSTLHTRRKWYGFWLGFLLLMTGAAVTWVMTTQPGSKEKNVTVFQRSFAVPVDEPITPEQSSAVIEQLNPFVNKSALVQHAFIPGPILTAVQPAETITEITDFDYPVALPQTIHTDPGKTYREFSTRLSIIPASSEINFPAETTPVVNAAAKAAAKRYAASQSPYTIESVTNLYQFKRMARKISWQLFVTPTISYRKLSVDKSQNPSSGFNFPFASLSDVNSAVTHKPDMGLQLGLSGRYPITRNLNLRGGIQFNINRYDIKAYAFNGEVATIDLNGGSGNNSISTWTYYRNYAGYKSDWLKNYYFSVSAPFGAEMKIFGNDKTNVGVAGTLQPTYILKDRAYLISTDYKNYAEVPRLIRHVNLNTSFETFVNYTNGKTRWQVGPQVRYQVLSSFHNKYPVKENLFDFGVKIGVTLNE